MVYYFTSKVVDPPANVYVGKDKYENEDLIKYGWEEDVCAHIYLRMNEGQEWDKLPQDLVTDLAQLTKANSIEGNKKDNITIIYTPWSNLLKDGSMVTGQVSFKNPRLVRRILVPARENAIINRLNKTRTEKLPPQLDLAAEKDAHLQVLRKRDQALVQARKKEELRKEREYRELKWQKDHAYDDIFTEDQMAGSSNQDRAEDWEEDFM